ncbi:MAG: PASTA domain-containing protein [Erysipelotrichaceae bacterium]|nr:PASTA domain-containing protein [Erysipelotrichaceae bacterium]
MGDSKDFLNEIAKEAGSKKIESFQEEKVERYQKASRSIDPKVLVGGLVVLALLSVVGYFVFLAPKIKMPDFVGQPKKEISAWIKQQGIEPAKIVVNEEYSLEVDENVVISQSIKEGTKIHKNAAITFVISKGANPDEKVEFPSDVLSLTKSDLNDWITKNKLSKVKITTAYSETIEEGKVISFDLKGVDRDSFTRGTNVTFTVSKGKQPAGTVTVNAEYQNEAFETFEAWAKTNKLVIDKTEVYDDKVPAGKIVYISIKKDQQIKQGETVVVKVSKGKAVVMIDFKGMSKDKVADWCATNTIKCYAKEQWSDSVEQNIVMSQSVKKGTVLDANSVVDYTVSLWRPDLLTFGGTTGADLQRWIQEQNRKGGQVLPDLKVVGGNINNPIIEWITPSEANTKKTYVNLYTQIEVRVKADEVAPSVPTPVEINLTKKDLKFGDASNPLKNIQDFCNTQNDGKCTYLYVGDHDPALSFEVELPNGLRISSHTEAESADVVGTFIKGSDLKIHVQRNP